VWPRKPGTEVILRKQGRAHALDQATLDENSLYHLSVPSCDGTYRVVWHRQDQLNAKGWHTFGY
jgi:hypothetical protein